MIALEARKTATDGDYSDLALQGDEYTRLMFIGFDLDLDEVHRLAYMAAMAFLQCAIANPAVPLDVAFKSTWVDGLLTGLMLAELQTRADRAEASDD